jgi:hypothetical protein
MEPLTERDIHQSIVDWLQVALPDGSVFHHSPNEGRHKVQYRVMQKRLGVRAGWPDIEIFANRTWWREDTGLHWAPVFLEIKTPTGRLSENQKRIHDKLNKAGCHVAVVRSIDETCEALSQLMELRCGSH